MLAKGRVPLFEPAANLVENLVADLRERVALQAGRKPAANWLQTCLKPASNKIKPGDFSSHVCHMTYKPDLSFGYGRDSSP